MSETTQISWCDSTFNPWIGCTKVSPGCANCYAAELDEKRYSKTLDGASKANPISHWGPGAPRHKTKTWGDPVRWNAKAKAVQARLKAETRSEFDAVEYERPRVFCASLADWLDDEVPIEWLADLFDLVRTTQNLDWLLLTKRPQNWYARIVAALNWVEGPHGEEDFPHTELGIWLNEWTRTDGAGIPDNIWIGTTVESQKYADERIPMLLKIPARVRFLSCEPLLGPLEFSNVTNRSDCVSVLGKPALGGIHWVICGGESGNGARPMSEAWATSIRQQCAAVNVPFFMKQLGGVRDKRGDLDQIPESHRVRELPKR